MMEKIKPTRSAAWQLLTHYNQNEALLRHALAVEAVMGHFAHLLKAENPEVWGIVGLIHDLDYEQYPEEHCAKTRQLLLAAGWPEDLVRAVESHGWGLVNDVEPLNDMEKVLYTIDELTGLIAATALLRPSKSIMDTELSSVKKKWKQKSFAAGVNREVIEGGAAKLGMELDQVIAETILGMRAVAGEIGLLGVSQS